MIYASVWRKKWNVSLKFSMTNYIISFDTYFFISYLWTMTASVVVSLKLVFNSGILMTDYPSRCVHEMCMRCLIFVWSLWKILIKIKNTFFFKIIIWIIITMFFLLNHIIIYILYYIIYNKPFLVFRINM